MRHSETMWAKSEKIFLANSATDKTTKVLDHNLPIFQYITLPNRHSFTVDSKDVFQRGQVLSYIRSKAPFLLEHISEAKERLITVTSRGLMIIYENDDHGLVIDLRSARNVLCTADRSKKQRHVN